MKPDVPLLCRLLHRWKVMWTFWEPSYDERKRREVTVSVCKRCGLTRRKPGVME